MTKVLYVEDHEAQRDIMVHMLELFGYEVDVAYDGEEGVKKAREWHPDVVLMDIRMAGTARWPRSHPAIAQWS
jgi:CheY-like chemotaxis protein